MSWLRTTGGTRTLVCVVDQVRRSILRWSSQDPYWSGPKARQIAITTTPAVVVAAAIAAAAAAAVVVVVRAVPAIRMNVQPIPTAE